MRTVGLIAEFNPFHNGHAAFIKAAKERANADYVVIVMSGDFVQRGEAAVMDKHLRTKAALINGADLVIELPPRFSTASAEGFAAGAVSCLLSLGVVTDFVFGTEPSANRLSFMRHIAAILNDEPHEYRMALKRYLKEGLPFPAAREKALQPFLTSEDELICLKYPNMLLGIEYLRAVDCYEAQFSVHAIDRIGAFHDTDANEDAHYKSASELRGLLAAESLPAFFSSVPQNLHSALTDCYQKTWPVFTDWFSILLHEKLLFATKDYLTSFSDVDSDLAGRVLRYRNEFQSISSFSMLLKNKAYTKSRISRALLHILLGIKKEDVPPLKAGTPFDHLHILGFQKTAVPLLHEISTHSRAKLITGKRDLACLSENSRMKFADDLSASLLYQMIASNTYKEPFRHEYTIPPVIL